MCHYRYIIHMTGVTLDLQEMEPAAAESCQYILYICILIYANTHFCTHIQHMTCGKSGLEDMEPVGLYTYLYMCLFVCDCMYI